MVIIFCCLYYCIIILPIWSSIQCSWFSCYFIYSAPDSGKKQIALRLYLIQLAVNFVWPLLFFNAQAFGLAFVWLLLLWGLVVAMLFAFYDVAPLAAWLQLPYLLWLTFAAYLSFGVLLLNV